MLAGYREPHRAYHTERHLEECFAHFDTVASLAERPAEIELALFFHDVIYDTQRSDNEARSAQWARRVLEDASRTAAARRVEDLIMATRHDALPEAPDARLLVDIDLSILGATPERFDEYELQIRQEYEWVPEPSFREQRAAILEQFLERPRIYNTPALHEECETQARTNLQRSLRRLTQTRPN